MAVKIEPSTGRQKRLVVIISTVMPFILERRCATLFCTVASCSDSPSLSVPPRLWKRVETGSESPRQPRQASLL